MKIKKSHLIKFFQILFYPFRIILFIITIILSPIIIPIGVGLAGDSMTITEIAVDYFKHMIENILLIEVE